MEILQLIEKKLQLMGITFDKEISEMFLDEVDQFIKNYCHIDCIPKELLYVRANLTVDYIRYQQANKPSEDGQVTTSTQVGPLTSIKSGDVQYNFADGSSKSQVHNAHVVNLDSLVTNYEHQLNEFRRLVW